MLYIVATPIGNLEDITLRAIRILKGVDGIVCEDTRETRKLLEHYEVRKPLYSLHERSSEKEYRFIISLLEAGKNLAYATDAGTPGIADPGNKLVAEIVKLFSEPSVAKSKGSRSDGRLGDVRGDVNEVLRQAQEVTIIPIPGPSTLTAAISICGFNMQEFRFYGFLPHKKGRQTKVKEIIDSEVPVVLFESKYRIRKLLEELLSVISSGGVAGAEKSHNNSLRTRDEISPLASQLGRDDDKRKRFKDRQIVVCNDLTKKFERVYRGTFDEVLQEIKKEEPKGEFVVVISSNSKQKTSNKKIRNYN